MFDERSQLTANDCACVPKTCSQAGAQCGSVSNGCGGTINCGSCGSNETCESNQCVPTQTPGDGIGSACSTSAQCGTSDATICIEWPGGYCSSRCNDAACASGSECKWIGITDQGCLKTCVRDTDCRTGYMCDERGSGAKVCTPNGPRTGEFGAPCNAAAECDSGVCHPTFYVCTQACSVGACPVGYGCDLVNQVCSLACAVDTDCPGVSACLFGTCFGTG